jgi:hypothetical protein
MTDDDGFPTQRVPSVEECEAEIVRVMRGARDVDLRHLGTIDEHIRVLIANSSDAVLTRINFEHAIERRIQLWQPNPVVEPLPTLHMLDLLRAWTPAGGFEKTFYLITRWKETQLLCVIPFARNRVADLRMRALRVLERYVSVSPQKENAAYTAYVEFLRNLLDDATYRLYSARRLSALHVISLTDDSIIPLLDEQPASIAALVQLAVDPDGDSSPLDQLTALYAKCKTRGRLLELQAAVRELGGQADVVEGRVTVVRLHGAVYELNQSKRQLAKTWQTMPGALSQTVNRLTHGGSTDDIEMGIATEPE